MSLVSVPFSFNAGTTALSAQVNSNFTTLANVINGNLDNTNVGTLGFYASQIIPTSSAQGMFGGVGIKYTFPANVVAVPANSLPAYSDGLGAATTATNTSKLGFGALNSATRLAAYGTTANATQPALMGSIGDTVAGVVGTLFEVAVQTVGGFLALDATGQLGIASNIKAGGAVIPGVSGTVGTAAVYSGTGTPSGTVTAPNGSLFLRYDGATASTVVYVNTSGASTSGTVWTAVTVP